MTGEISQIPAGMNFSGNPEVDAANYARQRGITIDAAKNELRAQYGDPVPPQQNQGTAPVWNSQKESNVTPQQRELLSKGIPAETIAQGDDAIRKYAQEHNIDIQAKSSKEFSLVPQSTPTEAKVSPEQAELLNKGIPQSVINQGDDTIRKYAQEHNSDIPVKGNVSSSSTSAASSGTASSTKTAHSERMTRKQAKAWMKEYSRQNKCSKKEAKAAFEEQFGYKVPDSKFTRAMKCMLLAAMSPVAVPLGIADQLAHGKLGFNKSVRNFLG